jgi:uracil-DNA glycosylase
MARHHIALKPGADFMGFRDAARLLVARGIPPDHVVWYSNDAPMLIGTRLSGDAPRLMLPRSATELVEDVVCHRDPERYALLYTMIWRVFHGERALPQVASDRLVHCLDGMRKSVRRDIHRMHAFLRFRGTRSAASEERFIAWFEPDHYILGAAAPFFIERFRALVWSIITPIGSLHWDRQQLTWGGPATRGDAPADDAFEPGWRGYYESTFNPTRANPDAMRLNMPRKYWRNMPETAAIPGLLRSAAARVETTIRDGGVKP